MQGAILQLVFARGAEQNIGDTGQQNTENILYYHYYYCHYLKKAASLNFPIHSLQPIFHKLPSQCFVPVISMAPSCVHV